MEQIIKKRDRFVACCNYCGDYLQETHGEGKSNVICHFCGRNMSVTVKKGRVTVYEEAFDNNLEYMRQKRYINIITRLKNINLFFKTETS